MRTDDFEYHLPDGLIAFMPAERREASRLLVLDRAAGVISHAQFKNIADYLEAGDLLVINDTKVIKARLLGRKEATGGKVEILLVREVGDGRWEALVSPSRKLKSGAEVVLGDKYRCVVIERLEGAKRVIEFPGVDVRTVIDEVGKVPLPPYIKRLPVESDIERYQTVYARKEGSVAAPTAGLHFSEELLAQIRKKGVGIASLTLHVGPGTFLPVKTDDPGEHMLDAEYFEMDGACCRSINAARREGGRVIAVGTTSVRTLETVAERSGGGDLKPQSGWTNKFILPPYDFQVVDALVTNFHLPRSTLLMLVCAFAGRDLIMKTYDEAVGLKYRFFSYGDAMLIV
ncbi:MAG: tRNA preQ1(34) S-adenosylmethionine ribosyltransferase-isomerase QueA [Candidatus Eisenbacteria bacterium]